MSERLPAAAWLSAPPTRAVIAALEAAGGAGCARFVGGCVRDTLLDRVADTLDIDIDIATPLQPPAVIAALETAGLRAVPTGLEHGVVTAIAFGRPFEIATLRRDVATDGRRAVVAYTDDWAQDAARRDFRLNALYAEPAGMLHDPTGGGLADAHAGRVAFVGEPEERIVEDYLRILRFFRFTAWYAQGAPDEAGLAACAALKGGLARLSAERVAKELLKLLAAPDPRPTLRVMETSGVLAEVLPEAAGLGRVDAIISLGAAADPLLRLAALLPDDRAAVRAAAVRLRLSNAQRNRLTAAVAEGEAAPDTPAAARRMIHTLGPQAFTDRLRLAWAGRGGGVDDPVLRDLAGLAWAPPAFPVTGADIAALGVSEGPEHGRLRRELERWWVERDFTPDRDEALAELRRLAGA